MFSPEVSKSSSFVEREFELNDDDDFYDDASFLTALPPGPVTSVNVVEKSGLVNNDSKASDVNDDDFYDDASFLTALPPGPSTAVNVVEKSGLVNNDSKSSDVNDDDFYDDASFLTALQPGPSTAVNVVEKSGLINNDSKSSDMTQNFYLPLNAYTKRIHKELVGKILFKNTFFVAPDEFLRANIAAILAYNFYKNFPNCGIVFVGNQELTLQIDLCKSLGIPVNQIFDFMNDHKRKKLIGKQFNGVVFIKPQTYEKLLPEHFCQVPLKLLVINEAEKAHGHSAMSKMVGATLETLRHNQFRVLALSDSLETNIAKTQSLIANLNISQLVIKNHDNIEIRSALYPRRAFVYDISVDESFQKHLNSWREGLINFTELLVSAQFFSESEPDVLIFQDLELWKSRAHSDDPLFANLIEVVPILIDAYTHLICYGYRAFFLFLSAKIPISTGLLEKIEENVFLSEVYIYARDKFGYDAFSPRDHVLFADMIRMHPKMSKLIDLLHEILINDQQKIMIFTNSCFGTRAVAELLNNWNSGRVLENFNMYPSLALDSRLIGRAQMDEKWIANQFKHGPENVLISSPYVKNFGVISFDTAIGLDYNVSSMEFMCFGQDSFSLLTLPYESLPREVHSFEQYGAHAKFKIDYKFRMGKSAPLFSPGFIQKSVDYWPKIIEPVKENLKTKESKKSPKIRGTKSGDLKEIEQKADKKIKGHKTMKNEELKSTLSNKRKKAVTQSMTKLPTTSTIDISSSVIDRVLSCRREHHEVFVKRRRSSTDSIVPSSDKSESIVPKRKLEPTRRLITDHFDSPVIQDSDFIDTVAEASKKRSKMLDHVLNNLNSHVAKD